MPAHVLLAHGASGTAASMRSHVSGLAARGVDATAIDLPKGNAERAVAVYAGHLARAPHPTVIGGHSYGGRVASMLAAQRPDGLAGLVLLSYPLHRPGHPEEPRTAHWPHIACPVLLLCGDRDPFARLDLVRSAVGLLPGARLVVYRHAGHGLGPVLDDVLDQVTAFVAQLGG
ncbi:MAG: alpha/beta hydrolase family protein [Candidatus Dormibacteria bacterium]